MVRRHWFVQPLHFAIEVVKCERIDAVNGKHGRFHAFFVTLSCDEGSAECAHDSGNIRANRLTACNSFKAAQNSVVVKRTALYDDMAAELGAHRKL